ncbi:ADP-ribosylation factor-like protein [Acrasis kona]|uniref:ADP-ribosylation factor-like protein n=1 Tax=Acrasis kona TaxID=1008807 RepID=A0AAW2Z940_9EUKA
MLSFIRNLFSSKNEKKETPVTVMFIGLDNAGKTTMLSTIQGETDTNTTPTIGFDKKRVVHGKYNITYFDLGGSKGFRGIWDRYYGSIHGAIFVVDSADENRLEEAKQALFESVRHPKFTGKSLLILANKQDKKESIPAHEIAQKLELDKLKSLVHRYNILPCSAIQAQNKPQDPQIKKGVTWLSESIDEQFESLNKRIEKDMRDEAEQAKLEREEKRRIVAERKAKEEELAKAEEEKKLKEQSAAQSPE